MTPRLPEAVEHWPLDRLRPDAPISYSYARDEVARIAAVIDYSDSPKPLLVSSDGAVIAGHDRLEEARNHGAATVPVVVIENIAAAHRLRIVHAE